MIIYNRNKKFDLLNVKRPKGVICTKSSVIGNDFLFKFKTYSIKYRSIAKHGEIKDKVW